MPALTDHPIAIQSGGGSGHRVRRRNMVLAGAASGTVIAIVVALQHFLLFHSRPLVLAVTLLAASAAYFLTRSSLHTFEVSIRYHLGLVSQESTMLYKEIDG